MTTEPDALTGVIHQPKLPDLELPEYHGRKPVGMKTSLMGAGTRINRPHSIGDRAILVIEAHVKTAGYEQTDDGLVYVEKLRMDDLFELDPEQGSRLLSTIRSLYRTGEDATKGRTPVPGLGDVGYTDASGVVLTPAEVADLRGDPVRAMLTPSLSPAVVEYSDGSRDLWPDEYAKDTPRPNVGDHVYGDQGEVIVVRLLNNETGEELPVVASSEETKPEPSQLTAADEAAIHAMLAGESKPSGEIPELPELVDETVVVHVTSGDSAELVDDEARVAMTPASDEWETPDPATERRLTIADPPTSADFEFMHRATAAVAADLVGISDQRHLLRLRKAEEQGRGILARPRKAALSSIDARLTAVIAEQRQAQ